MENNIEALMKQHNIDSGGRDLIDLTSIKDHTGFDLDGYVVSSVFDDIVLVDMIDVDDNGLIKKDALYVQTSKTIKTWRKGKIALKGKLVDQCNIGDVVIFPNDNGIQVSNLNVKDYGLIKRGIFISSNKLFAVCEPLNK